MKVSTTQPSSPGEASRPLRFVAALASVAAVLVGVGWGGRTEARGQNRSGQAGVVKAGHRQRALRRAQLTIEVNGDILVHGPVWQQALVDGHGRYDFAPMLREIRPYIKSADLAICHIETPLSPRPPHGYPVFNTPTQLARAIKQTGWRICDTASNHSVDQANTASIRPASRWTAPECFTPGRSPPPRRRAER